MCNNAEENIRENLIDLQSAYKSLSHIDDIDFMTRNEISMINKSIEKTFSEDFLKIDTKELQNEDNLLNIRFIELIKFCAKLNYKNPHIIFITFCDYFDLEYNKTYQKLHEKLQLIIRNGSKKLLGDVYKKHRDNHENTRQFRNLFDLI